jgi:hypothetical protein
VGLFKTLGLLNDETKGKDKGLNAADNAVTKNGWQFGNWLEKEFPGYAQWRKQHSDILGADSDGGVGTGTKDDSGPSGFSDKLLNALEQNESSGVNGQTNAKTGAAGLFGITPGNYKAAGVDPMDPVASRALAKKILDGFVSQFDGDIAKAVAAYDGDTHVAADSKKFAGHWVKGATQETIDYLKKTELQGFDLGLSPEDQAYIDAHTKVKGGAKAKAAATQDNTIDGFQMVPYDDASPAAGAATAAGDKGVIASYMDRLHQGFGMIGSALREGGGSQFAMPAPAQPVNQNQQAPVAVNVTLIQPAGSNQFISMGGIPN